jgi:hypothetical protein
VHDEVSGADSERLGASKLHDAAGHCNWVKPFENPFVRRVKRRIDMRFKSRMSKYARLASLCPTNQQGIDFVSASSAVHVQTSPAPLAFISALQFFLSRDERPNLAKYLNSN